MIAALILIVAGTLLRSRVSQMVAGTHEGEWLAEFGQPLNTAFLNGKDFRRFRSRVLGKDSSLRRLDRLSTALVIAGLLVFIAVPVASALRAA